MKALWWLMWALLFAQLIAIPFWPKIFRKVVRRWPAGKLWSWTLSGLICFCALGVLILFVVPFAYVTLTVARDSALADKKDTPSEYYIYPHEKMADVRGQIHVHCYLSHDSTGTLEDIADAAKKNGVRWVMLTDHIDELPPGNYPDVINGVRFIYGNERDIERDEIEESVSLSASLKDAELEFKAHGHIEGFGRSGVREWKRWDAIEIVNFHSNMLASKAGILGSVFFNPEGFYENLAWLIPENLEQWQEMAEREGRPIPIFGAPDAHKRWRILGVRVDPYELLLGRVSTHIWVEKDKKLDQAAIFEAIKKGHTYVSFEDLGDPTGFKFYAETMKTRCMTGEAMLAPKYLSVLAPEVGSEITVKFYRDNILVGKALGSMAYWPNPEPGFWRVELWRKGRPWIVSGQILIL